LEVRWERLKLGESGSFGRLVGDRSSDEAHFGEFQKENWAAPGKLTRGAKHPEIRGFASAPKRCLWSIAGRQLGDSSARRRESKIAARREFALLERFNRKALAVPSDHLEVVFTKA
jgi:hypothetical protein